MATSDIDLFLKAFYKASDVKPPASNADPYLSFFTPNATLVMGSATILGHEGITRMRQGMWTAVTTRHHVVNDVARLSDNELLLTGTVDYGLLNGKSLRTEWAGKAVFEDSLFTRMSFYQVYLDSAPMAKALSDA